MAKEHPLLEYRVVEYEFERVFRDIDRRRESPEFLRDVEFYGKLEALIHRHGFTLPEAADLLQARCAAGVPGVEGNQAPDQLSARTIKQLLEMVGELKDQGSITAESNPNAR